MQKMQLSRDYTILYSRKVSRYYFITPFLMFTVCLFINIAMTWCYAIDPVKVRHIEVQAVQVHYDKVVDRATEMITRYE